MSDSASDTRIVVRCLSCDAKIRASRTLAGRTCPCPRCRGPVIVRPPLPSDADIALVLDHQRS